MPEVICSILPSDFREYRAQWYSSGTVSAFDFGAGMVYAPASFPVEVSGSSIDLRPDALTFDYNIAFSYGPVITGSAESGSLNRAWRAAHFYDDPVPGSGTIYLARETDSGTEWEVDFPLFTYSGSEINEIDLVFDQSGRPVIAAARDSFSGHASQSFVWLYRFVDTEFRFLLITTGSTPRVILDEPVYTEISDILLFYRKGLTHETAVSASNHMIFTTGSGITDVVTTYHSHSLGSVKLTLQNYAWTAENYQYPGNFMSFQDPGHIGPAWTKPLTGTLYPPVRAVGVALTGHQDRLHFVEAYDQFGSFITRSYFIPSQIPSDWHPYDYNPSPSKDVVILFATGTNPANLIHKFYVDYLDTDDHWVGFDGILMLPDSGTEGGVNNSYGLYYLYYREQRDDYLTETAIPLTDQQFYTTMYEFSGSITGAVGVGTVAPEMVGTFHDTTYISGTLRLSGAWSGSYVGWPELANIDYGLGVNSTNLVDFENCRDGDTSTYWDTSTTALEGYQFEVTFSGAQDIGGFLLDTGLRPTEFPTELSVQFKNIFSAWATESIHIVTSSLGIFFDDPLTCTALRFTVKTPSANRWSIAEMKLFTAESTTQSDLTGSLWGYATGSAYSVLMSGTFDGTFIAETNSWYGITTGSSSIYSIEDVEYKYELFLEDAVKLTDNRVSLYVSRRNIDSSSVSLGEYAINKLESVVYPVRIVDEANFAVASLYISGALLPILGTSERGEYFIDMATTFPSGTHVIHNVILSQSFLEDHFWRTATTIPSESHALYEIYVTHSVYDRDVLELGTIRFVSESYFDFDLVERYQRFDYVEGYASKSFTMTSGSLEQSGAL